MSQDIINPDVYSWIDRSIGHQDLKSNYKVNVTGTSKKGDGYVGDIIFASVRGKTEENAEKELHLVIKHGKINEYLRKIAPVREAFLREIFIYDKVMPLFKKFQLDKNIEDRFQSFPKCYNTLLFNGVEVLVMNNLKKHGYKLYDRTKPLNLNHMKLVLKEYGKWHALSFALRDQKYDDYKSLTVDTSNVLLKFVADWNSCSLDPITKVYNQILNIFKEKGEHQLYEKLKTLMGKEGPRDKFIQLAKQSNDESESVITHGDCWNNNFMYKYKDNDNTTPSKVAILDWQMSYMHSPVYDLAYFIYSTSSKNQLDCFDELMEVYYKSFSNFLIHLGSDPEKLFPLSTLKRHWKKYSLFGFLFMLFVLPIVLCSSDKAPALEDFLEAQDDEYINNMDPKQKDMYFERAKSVLIHYLESKF